MLKRSLHLRYLFGGSKNHSHETAGAHNASAHSHDHHDHLPTYEHDPHNLGKESYIIEGNDPVRNLAKKWLRFVGWEPDTPRSRTESTHFNEHLNLPLLHEKPNSLYRYMTYLPYIESNSGHRCSESSWRTPNSRSTSRMPNSTTATTSSRRRSARRTACSCTSR